MLVLEGMKFFFFNYLVLLSWLLAALLLSQFNHHSIVLFNNIIYLLESLFRRFKIRPIIKALFKGGSSFEKTTNFEIYQTFVKKDRPLGQVSIKIDYCPINILFGTLPRRLI